VEVIWASPKRREILGCRGVVVWVGLDSKTVTVRFDSGLIELSCPPEDLRVLSLIEWVGELDA